MRKKDRPVIIRKEGLGLRQTRDYYFRTAFATNSSGHGDIPEDADGAVLFHTFVRAWKYTEPAPLYGKYTTKEWTKYLIERRQDIEPAGALIYRNESFTVYSKEELDRMIGILHGRLFDGFRQGLFILWGYRMEWKELPAWEWNMLKAETHLSFLGVSPVRIRTDHDGHTVTIYKKSE